MGERIAMPSPVDVASPPALPREGLYGRQGFEDAGFHRARNVIAVTAALYGVSRIIGTALQLALAKGWAASPSTMGWAPVTAWGAVLMAVRSAADAGLVLGGLLLIARCRAGVHLLRVSVCALIVITVLGLIKSMIEIPEIRRQWSTPAAAAQHTLSYLGGFFMPLLIGFLTLLPLAPPGSSRSAAVPKANTDA
jgi:hypothetical protein